MNLLDLSRTLTCPKEAQRIQRIARYLGNPSVPTISWDAVKSYHDAHGHAGSTRNRTRTILRRLGVKVPRVKEKQVEAEFLSEKELEKMDRKVRESGNKPMMAIYAILRETGCRGLTELSRVTLEGIDWEERTMKLCAHKGIHRIRIVPLTDIGYNAVAWWAHEGFRLPPYSSWIVFWRSVAPPGKTPYSMRHTFCSRLLDSGVPVGVAMRIMGHSSLEMTQRYLHLRASAIHAARTALEHGLPQHPRTPQAGPSGQA